MTGKGRSQVSRLSISSIGAAIALCLSLELIGATQSTAQIVPDQTLGRERSRVQQNVEVRGRRGTQIEGGAIRVPEKGGLGVEPDMEKILKANELHKRMETKMGNQAGVMQFLISG